MTDASPTVPLPLPAERREPWPTFLRSMFRVGVNTFGGPVAQIGTMHQEAVDRRGWITDGQFVQLVNFANLLPGPEALEVAIHLGYLRRGVPGGIAAGLLFIWPGFVALTALAWIHVALGEVAAVSAFFAGIRPIAVALIAFAVVRLSLRVLKGPLALALMAAAFVAHLLLDLPFPLLLLGCGTAGALLGGHRGTLDLGKAHRPLILALLVAALATGFLRERSPAPGPRARGPAPAAVQERGTRLLGELAWINTKAALLTFGGAYTALPYLHDQMVRDRGWLSEADMADGLALGETTPGPLLCVAVFLSYLVAGPPGALVSCFFLFLPSFVLVLALGRHLHRIQTLPWAPGFLWGVSAGTIGLILSLSARLAPGSLGGPLDAALATAALGALWGLRAHPLLVVIGGGLLGILRPPG